MSTSNVKPIPDGMHSLTPHLCVAGAADAIEFYKKAFGAVEMGRIPMPDGKLAHAMIRIGDSTLMLADENPSCGMLGAKAMKGTPVTIHLYVEDADATVRQAEAAGAKVIMPVAEMFWGDRYGRVEDPFGHSWSVATHVKEVSGEDMQKAVASMGAPAA